MRTLAPLPRTIFSQVVSPTSWMSCTSQRPTELFIQESSDENRSLNSHDLEFDDYTIGMALSSPLFTQEREDAASRRQASHSPDESLLPAPSLSVCHVRTGRPTHERSSPGSSIRENPCRGSENEQIKILLERQREQILADFRAEIQKHEFQAEYDRRSIQKLNEAIESQRGEIYVLIKETNNFNEINKFFMNNYWSRIGIFVKLMRKVSMRWEN